MIDRILVPIDDSTLAATALDYAFENFPDAGITVLHGSTPPTRAITSRPAAGSTSGTRVHEPRLSACSTEPNGGPAITERRYGPSRRSAIRHARSSSTRTRRGSTRSSSGATAVTASPAFCWEASRRRSSAGREFRWSSYEGSKPSRPSRIPTIDAAGRG
jgi:hypothetical protein